MKRLLLVMLSTLLLVIPGGVMLAQDGGFVQSVCLITDIGRVNDGTFNEFAYAGMQEAVAEYGLEDTFIETATPSDYANNINTCLEGDYDIIITVGFALADAAYAAAEANPDVFFIGVDQDFTAADPLSNIVGIQFREDQAGFLAGAMAAMMTETGVVGGVYGLDIFPVVKFRHGFETGARYIDPDIETLGVYIPDFQAPDRGQEAAAQFVGEGADVIFGAGGPTGSGGIAWAAQQGVYVIGVDQDEYFTTFGGGESPGAENLLTSAIKRVDVGVYDMIVAVVEGIGFPENSTYVLEIANGGIGYAPTHDAPVPPEVTDTLDAIIEGLGDGTLWTGIDPITGEYSPTLLEMLEASGNYTLLLEALTETGLLDTLMEDGSFTLFAPSDTAFVAALETLGLELDEFLSDTELLISILTYHVVDRALVVDALFDLDGSSVVTVNGADLMIEALEDGLLVGSVPVFAADLLLRGGVIHAVEAVLVPPLDE